ncbi:uncharacterized protein BP5553_10286 [Venustampulla echinocandica]|uniref:Zn(2)-C6 fungal-type domain-containing protein n=1 Tax=Venustampulla echinocandica TaxID=2656787 RepID=A0A370T9R3_9HELO|nr:uncharacterized protein BP5553_10286 [Venustampulla echinocandica]RDL30408.1 hypothetical protein BP5553_10286 [Venustampulla echinocandica]
MAGDKDTEMKDTFEGSEDETGNMPPSPFKSWTEYEAYHGGMMSQPQRGGNRFALGPSSTPDAFLPVSGTQHTEPTTRSRRRSETPGLLQSSTEQEAADDGQMSRPQVEGDPVPRRSTTYPEVGFFKYPNTGPRLRSQGRGGKLPSPIAQGPPKGPRPARLNLPREANLGPNDDPRSAIMDHPRLDWETREQWANRVRYAQQNVGYMSKPCIPTVKEATVLAKDLHHGEARVDDRMRVKNRMETQHAHKMDKKHREYNRTYTQRWYADKKLRQERNAEIDRQLLEEVRAWQERTGQPREPTPDPAEDSGDSYYTHEYEFSGWPGPILPLACLYCQRNKRHCTIPDDGGFPCLQCVNYKQDCKTTPVGPRMRGTTPNSVYTKADPLNTVLRSTMTTRAVSKSAAPEGASKVSDPERATPKSATPEAVSESAPPKRPAFKHPATKRAPTKRAPTKRAPAKRPLPKRASTKRAPTKRALSKLSTVQNAGSASPESADPETTKPQTADPEETDWASWLDQGQQTNSPQGSPQMGGTDPTLMAREPKGKGPEVAVAEGDDRCRNCIEKNRMCNPPNKPCWDCILFEESHLCDGSNPENDNMADEQDIALFQNLQEYLADPSPQEDLYSEEGGYFDNAYGDTMTAREQLERLEEIMRENSLYPPLPVPDPLRIFSTTWAEAQLQHAGESAMAGQEPGDQVPEHFQQQEIPAARTESALGNQASGNQVLQAALPGDQCPDTMDGVENEYDESNIDPMLLHADPLQFFATLTDEQLLNASRYDTLGREIGRLEAGQIPGGESSAAAAAGHVSPYTQSPQAQSPYQLLPGARDVSADHEQIQGRMAHAGSAEEAQELAELLSRIERGPDGSCLDDPDSS